MEALGDNTWMDCLYLNEANEALYECRYALKFTYVFAFYLPKEANFRHHFEMNQTDLEKQTEDLAEMLEKDVSEIQRMEVRDACMLTSRSLSLTPALTFSMPPALSLFQVVHSFQMAKKRLRALMELVEAERLSEQANGDGASSSSDAPSSSALGSA